MSKKILTIIVPTYNMEDYLYKCLNSLVIGESDSELMHNFEVLVVNDGSTDKSSEIAHSYVSKYPNTFKVIDKENGNYGSCINVALPVAKSKYVKVLDADDWFDTVTFKQFIVFLNNVDVDAVINDYDTVNLTGDVTETFTYSALPSRKDFELSDMFIHYCDMQTRAVTYRTELLRDIGYHQSEGLFYTDQEWIYFPLSQAKRLRYFPGHLYKYLMGREGQTINMDVWEKNFWMEIQVVRNILHTYLSHYNDLGHEYLRIRFFDRFKTIFEAMLLRFPSAKNDAEVRRFDQEIYKLSPDLYEATNAVYYPLGLNHHYYYVKLWRMGIPRRIVKFLLSVVFIYNHHICREVPSKPTFNNLIISK